MTKSEYGHRTSSTQVCEGEYLSDVSPKDKPWDVHKGQSDLVSLLYYGSGYERYAERVFDCGGRLGFQHTSEGKLVLVSAHFCRVRYCPTCQWRRSLMWRARFHRALPAIIEKHPTARWVFLTLTVKNCDVDDLRNTLRTMNAAWQRLIQLRRWPALGFVRATEVTKSEDGKAHPHFHCLLLVKPSYFGSSYIKQDEWALMWQKALRSDYKPVVDIRTVKAPQNASTGVSALSTAIQETLKYTVKPDDLVTDDEWLTAVTEQTFKLKFIATGGVLKDCLGDEEPKSDQDLIDVENSLGEEKPTGEVALFGWNRDVRRYRKEKASQV